MATAPEEAAVAVTLDLIRLDGGTQMRAEFDEETRSEYASIVRSGVDLPAVTLFYDGSAYWLADGYHRYFAYKDAGAVELPADIRAGTKRDAILYSVGANANHGLRRTNEDKRKSVLTLLQDEEWTAWSDREIARRAHVDHKTVARLRDEHLGNSPDSLRLSVNDGQMERTVTRNGTTYQQNTANIGGAKVDSGESKKSATASEAVQPPAANSGSELSASSGPLVISHKEFIGHLEQIASVTPASVIKLCPPRDRARLCQLLSGFIDTAHEIMKGASA